MFSQPAESPQKANWRPRDPRATEQSQQPHSTVKRRVGLLVGFLGTRYHGIEKQPPPLATVQGELERAAHQAKLILDSNYSENEPSRVDFHCSSRTDAGVHAAWVLCAPKLELAPAATEQDELKQLDGSS